MCGRGSILETFHSEILLQNSQPLRCVHSCLHEPPVRYNRPALYAALGRVTAEELEAEIAVKRNKDLLMSYGLVPFRDFIHCQ